MKYLPGWKSKLGAILVFLYLLVIIGGLLDHKSAKELLTFNRDFVITCIMIYVVTVPIVWIISTLVNAGKFITRELTFGNSSETNTNNNTDTHHKINQSIKRSTLASVVAPWALIAVGLCYYYIQYEIIINALLDTAISSVLIYTMCAGVLIQILVLAMLHGYSFRVLTYLNKHTIPEYSWRLLIQVLILYVTGSVSYAAIYVFADEIIHSIRTSIVSLPFVLISLTSAWIVVICLTILIVYCLTLFILSKIFFKIETSVARRGAIFPSILFAVFLLPVVAYFSTVGYITAKASIDSSNESEQPSARQLTTSSSVRSSSTPKVQAEKFYFSCSTTCSSVFPVCNVKASNFSPPDVTAFPNEGAIGVNVELKLSNNKIIKSNGNLNYKINGRFIEWVVRDPATGVRDGDIVTQGTMQQEVVTQILSGETTTSCYIVLPVSTNIASNERVPTSPSVSSRAPSTNDSRTKIADADNNERIPATPQNAVKQLPQKTDLAKEDIRKISFDQSNLYRVDSAGNKIQELKLQLTVHNHLDRPQRFPHLLLSLKDDSGVVQIKKIINPILFTKINTELLQANEIRSVEILFVMDNNTHIGGYQVRMFFPNTGDPIPEQSELNPGLVDFDLRENGYSDPNNKRDKRGEIQSAPKDLGGSANKADWNSGNVFQSDDLNSLLLYGYKGDLNLREAVMNKINTIPKPSTGDRATARKLNTQGLASLQKGDYAAATMAFLKGTEADPSDVEIINNYGFALLRSNQLDASINALEKTLLIAPNRTSAWFNVYDLLVAQRANVSNTCRAALVGLRLSKDPIKSMKYLQDDAIKENDPIAKQGKTEALTCANTTMYLESTATSKESCPPTSNSTISKFIHTQELKFINNIINTCLFRCSEDIVFSDLRSDSWNEVNVENQSGKIFFVKNSLEVCLRYIPTGSGTVYEISIP